MSAQTDRIALLSAEVDTLKSTISGHQASNNGQTETEKDERIRELERELEKLRS